MIIITYLSQKSLIKYLDVDINLNSNFKLPENTVLQIFFPQKIHNAQEMCCLPHVLLYPWPINETEKSIPIDNKWWQLIDWYNLETNMKNWKNLYCITSNTTL